MAFEKIQSLKNKMEEVINFFKGELAKIRTGRANSTLVEDLKVPYYGKEVPLKTVALISVPQTNLISVQPWDTAAFNDIETALRNSNLGFNVSNDGRVIRLAISPMTFERREELIKLIGRIAEENKVKLRNLRREIWDEIRTEQRSGVISEDDKYDAQKELQDLIEEFEDKINQELKKKETEIKQI